MECSIYAPVLIPTLNRVDHLKRCLESLESCSGAEQTEVFVALDYPPSEEYYEGWKENNLYLCEKEIKNGFKRLTVIKRNYNYGLKSNAANVVQLVEEVIIQYDRYILSEDDNVFSPNFLEYINKGLELYKNDKRVFAICGYKNDFVCKYDGNNHFMQHSLVQAWGYGIWKNRYIELKESLTPSYFRHILFNPKKWYRCYNYWPHWTIALIQNATSPLTSLRYHDINMGFYVINENKCVVCPVISKVRNEGFDDSATTTNLNKGNLKGRAVHEMNLSIDDEEGFDFIGDPYLYEDENSMAIAKWDGQWETECRRNLIYVYLRIVLFRFLALFGIV